MSTLSAVWGSGPWKTVKVSCSDSWGHWCDPWCLNCRNLVASFLPAPSTHQRPAEVAKRLRLFNVIRGRYPDPLNDSKREPSPKINDPHDYIGETRGLLEGSIFWDPFGGSVYEVEDPKLQTVNSKPTPEPSGVVV